MKQIITAISALVLLAACGSNKEDADYTPAPSVMAVDTQTQKPKDGLEQLTGAATASPQAPVITAAQPQTAAAAPVAAAPTPAGINPPHGQPGHRCDIPDGAPLNSAPAAAAQTAQPPVTVQKITPAQMTAPAQAAPTAKGMNPPHGQPGHRCDIAVGAPLNSKPAAQPAAQPAPAQPITVMPQQATAQQPAAAPAPTAPGMNPPHGQPGHRCDISVGAPLNSKPAKKDSAK